MKINLLFQKGLVLGLFVFVLVANAKNYLPDSIKGVKITPQSLMALAPSIPEQLRMDLNRQFFTSETNQLLSKLLNFSDIKGWTRETADDNVFLEEAGYKNLSTEGYVARIPGTDYVFKVAGKRDRIISMLATKGIVLAPDQQDDQTLYANVDCCLQEILPSYQTASRMAYYLLLKKRAQQKGYKHIRMPESYLIAVPGTSFAGVSDDTVMLIQKMVPGAEILAKNPERAADFSKGIVKELTDAIISVGLWNIEKNILISADDSIYVICNVNLVGLSQQKNSSAKDFFHKSKERFDENVYIGLRGLLNLFKNDPKKAAYIKKRIKKDKRLKGSLYADCLKELIK